MKKKLNLKYLNEWGLDSKSKRIVRRELQKWMKVFLDRADNASYQVEECNFKEGKLFFFTKCQDILKDKPEETGLETSFDIRRRKRNVMFALFLKEMLGEKIRQWSRLCSHCGNSNMVIKHASDATYYRHCPDCKRLIIDTYESDMHPAFINLLNEYNPSAVVKKDTE